MYDANGHLTLVPRFSHVHHDKGTLSCSTALPFRRADCRASAGQKRAEHLAFELNASLNGRRE